MDLRRISEIVLFPIAILVTLNIALILISPIVPSELLFLIIHMPYIVGIYAGYKVSKEDDGDMGEAAVGGAITLAVGLLLNTLLFFLLLRIGVIDMIAGFYGAGEKAVIVSGTNAICLVMDMAVFAIIGGVLGAIGGFIAERR
jgi:hypothetical protein